MKAGIFANPTKAEAPQTLKLVTETLAQYGIESVLDVEAGELMGIDGTKDFYKGVDLVLSLGGDGTMLETVRRMEKETAIPIAGVNIGTLGFLTTCTDEDFPKFAQYWVEGELETTPLSMLRVEILKGGEVTKTFLALNELVLMRGNTGRLVSIDASINGKFLTHYKSDGLIVSTPTGSTAYSLAAGGPIIAPGSGVVVINPICPHTLSNRALVVPSSSEITLQSCEGINDPVFFSTDGRDVFELTPRSTVRVSCADLPVELLQMPNYEYYEKLRAKLGWSGGSSNSCH